MKKLSLLAIVFLLAACSTVPARNTSPGKLNVVASTTIIGDIVQNVGGDAINLTVLLPVGADPHSFSPTPQDITKVAHADIIFVNGFGLEQFLGDMVENAATKATIVEVSQGVEPLTLGTVVEDGQSQPEEAGRVDPHTWTSPANAIIFVRNIEQALTAADPDHAEIFAENAKKYTDDLTALDEWVQAQIETIPPENRKLVTGHTAFGYYAKRYGLEQIGTVIPGFSTAAEPSAQDLAALQDTINQYSVNAIFIGTTVNPTVSARIAEDTGAQLVRLYTGSLGEKGSGADTYINYIKYNTNAIVTALK